MKKFLSRAGIAFAVAASSTVPAAHAQNAYPTKPVKLIVEGPAGGINDIWARRYGQRISESMGQPVVVDNRPGASGTIAAEALARSAPDGYTVMYGGMNPLVAYPGAGGKVRFDPAQDLVPVGLSNMGYPMLTVGAGSGIKSVQELIAKAKAAKVGDELTCGTGGNASVGHFACAQFGKVAGIRLRLVPYKSNSLAAQDAANGVIHMAPGFSSEIEPLTTGGRLLPVGAFAPARLPKFPGTQTMGEAGLPGMDLTSFAMFFVPAGTSAAIVEKLNAELIKAMARPEMTEWLVSAGGVYKPMKPAELLQMLHGEQAKWKRMSSEFGIEVQN
jgi:tripartite-type tricarboxylate transporter receptor subunit TctC